MSKLAIGVVGLGVMGRNLALNLEEHGFSVGVWDAWPDPVDTLVAATAGKNIRGFHERGLCAALERPRRIILLVKAGEVVDTTDCRVVPFLSPGDVLVDGGNERYENTERRAARLAERASTTSAWASPAARAERVMAHRSCPAASPEGYAALEPVLTKIAAQHADGPCVTLRRARRRRATT